ncbi:MAG: ABC transporter permease [Verrucomicrobiota bacterium]
MSELPFELLLALRYLRPKRTFVSVITLISVLGVALGVAVLIIVISVMSGFDRQLRETVFGFTAHLTVLQRNQTMTNYEGVMKQITGAPGVKGVAPFVMAKVYLETEPTTGQAYTEAPIVRGIDPLVESNVSVLPRSVVEGDFDVSGHGIVVGTAFARNMRLEVGDRVSIYGPRELKKMKESRTREAQAGVLPDEFVVRGIFDAGYYDFNSSYVVMSLENAQDLYDLGNSVHGLMVSLNDPFAATSARAALQKKIGPDYDVLTWLDQSPLLAAVLVEKNVMLYILFFIVIVAAFGITCTLITFIVMKTREIGVMKALGASNRQVMWVFMAQSLLVSVFGVLAGTSLGLLAIRYRNEFLELMRRLTGMELFPQSIYGFSSLPALIIPGDILIICGGSLIICLAAAAFPARYASRLNPVEALRYE